jgi:hypothetical protein
MMDGSSRARRRELMCPVDFRDISMLFARPAGLRPGCGAATKTMVGSAVKGDAGAKDVATVNNYVSAGDLAAHVVCGDETGRLRFPT